MVPLEIRLNVFRQSTIPKKQFIIIIIVPKNIIKMIKKIEREREREREREQKISIENYLKMEEIKNNMAEKDIVIRIKKINKS